MAEGLVAIDEALARSERTEGRWGVAELLRIKGELALQEAASNAAEAAEALFLKGLGWARDQGALAWELRTVTSLARLWHGGGRTPDAHELFAPIYDRSLKVSTLQILQRQRRLWMRSDRARFGRAHCPGDRTDLFRRSVGLDRDRVGWPGTGKTTCDEWIIV
jgi:predicted ATPase